MRSVDVAIVGGGPAGLATAIELRRRGLEVRVLDRAGPPIDKGCGEGIMPDGLRRLSELGVELGGRAFRGIRYVDEQVEAEADFPGGPGRVVRRPELHRALVERAHRVGVELKWKTQVRGLDVGARRLALDDGEFSARWIVGADGLHSRVRSWSGLEGRPRRRRRFGVRRHFRVAPWSDYVEVHWGRDCEAYVSPSGPDEVGVAFLWSGGRATFEALRDRFPALDSRLGPAEPVSRALGAGPLDQRPRAVTRGRVALVGDASGYRDAITGEGLSLAFLQSSALADAIVADDPSAYARAHRRLARLPFLLISALLFAERRPWLRHRFVRALARDPGLFEQLLALHVGELPLHGFGWRGAVRLGAGLLARTG